MAREFYIALMKVLRDQPILAAFIGIVFMFVVGGSTGALIQKIVPEAQNPGMIYASTFLGTLLIYLLLVLVLRPNASGGGVNLGDGLGGQVRVVPDPRISALSDAIDQLKKIVDSQWVKSDLHFDVTITGIEGEPHQAELSLSASFRVINITDKPVSFVFFTEVEAGPQTESTLTGHLSVRNAISQDLVHDLDIKLKQEGQSPIRRHKHNATMLSPRSETIFQWTVNGYRVLLPYSEYWASAHPVLNIQVQLKVDAPELRASAVIYRPPEQGTDEEPDIRGDISVWKSHGVFLPYQGIFIKVFRQQKGQS